MYSPSAYIDPQFPGDKTSRQFDLTAICSAMSDTIESVIVTETTNIMTVSNTTFTTAGLVTYWITGGVSGTNYTISCAVNFTSGLNETFTAYLVVS